MNINEIVEASKAAAEIIAEDLESLDHVCERGGEPYVPVQAEALKALLDAAAVLAQLTCPHKLDA